MLKKRIALITGASRGIGAAVAERFAGEGAHIIGVARTKQKLEDLDDKIKKIGGTATLVPIDLTDDNSIDKMASSISDRFGKIDILLNAAGGNMSGATIGENQNIFDLSLEEFSKVTELNLNGSVIPSLIFGKVMAKQKSGVIINYSSMSADRVISRVVGYSASKAAIENFTKWMSVEMALKFNGKIRVNAIAPGFFIGNQNKDLLLNKDGSYTHRGNTIINNTPMKRFGKAEELNGAIHFLCSDASSFITGVVLPIDGGFSAFSGV